MIVTLCQIGKMKRKELIEFLESWGYQCYDYETTRELRECARQHAGEDLNKAKYG